MLWRLLSGLRAKPPAARGTGTGETPESLVARADALRDRGDLEAALEVYRECLESAPSFIPAYAGLTATLSRSWRTQECIETCAEALRLAPDNLQIFSAYLMFSHFTEAPLPQWRYELHRRYGAVAERLTPTTDLARRSVSADPERRLRLGYVSRDFYEHSVTSFFEPLLEHHDRSRYDVYCYYTREHRDDTTARLTRLASVWRDVHADAPEALARRIAGDEIDILVDLGGHTLKNALPVFARRPAPLQMTWLGYPDTTGLTTIDYRITDAIADPPPSSDALSSERLLRLGAPFLCYQPPVPAPPASKSPREHVVFGSFNVILKVNAALIECWARILDAVPGSRLLLKASLLDIEQTRARLFASFAAAGIDPARVELRPPTVHRVDHLAAYNDVDVALDTFPYNGTTTTCEALWMGVPVVTLSGDAHMSRVGATLLQSVGLGAFVAADSAEYVRIAVEIARDRERRESIHRGLRQQLRASSLLDHAGFTRRFETALRDKWSAWCAQYAAEHGEPGVCP